jgi:hypothetical protein
MFETNAERADALVKVRALVAGKDTVRLEKIASPSLASHGTSSTEKTGR